MLGAQIRQATSQAFKNNPEAATKLRRASLAKHAPAADGGGAGAERERDPQRDKDTLMYTKDDLKIDRIVQRHNDETSKEPNTPKPKEKVDMTATCSKTDAFKSNTNRTNKRDADKEGDDDRKEAHPTGVSSSKRKDESEKPPHSERDRTETGRCSGNFSRQSAINVHSLTKQYVTHARKRWTIMLEVVASFPSRGTRLKLTLFLRFTPQKQLSRLKS